ncbi:hypothetical protein FHR99_002186 [Litorivivens lipolytica]|uniref:Uncharacterized protein n=1 Tax=Litorivivens lipolytica TaxID=1524264 RepID=A0A7W4W5P9_9GAMM|nr:hypothetical protein [Litorivivens lipolytica]MBB3047920.1 hypothetical protein [Litorivivens lipolytica]
MPVFNPLSRSVSLGLTVAAVVVAGCTVTHQQALEPLDWVGADIERYPVTGAGSWARLRKQPLLFGPFTGEVVAQSIWSLLPATTNSDVQVSVGSDSPRGHQLNSGTVTQHNESELQVNFSGPEGPLANLRCRQMLHIEEKQTGIRRNDGTDSMSMKENVAYTAALNCKSKGAGPQWPQWQLDMSTNEPEPMQGVLEVAGTRFDVVGSQASTIGQAPSTVSYEIRRGEHTLALIDRSGDGTVSLSMPAGDRQHNAFAGAAAVLLLANDPLQP